MNFVDRVKSLFKKGGYALSGQTLKSINDHPKINIDPAELARIERNLRQYQGDYPKVEYVNSHGNTKERDYMTLNLRKLSADVLGGLIFNEQCEVTVSDAKEEEEKENSFKSAHEFIEHVFEHNKFKKNLADYLEPMLALGGLTVRPYVDAESGEIEFSWAIANAFYPLRNNSNGISEGVMKSVTTKIEGNKTTYYTLLEFHEWENELYVITNELYKSESPNEIGKRVALEEVYEGLQERAEITGLSRPLFNYLKPSGFNNINPHSPLGLGIADNAVPTLKKINDTYDQFWWEIKMGQRTVFVSDAMLNTLPDESGRPPKQVFDPDVNVYKSIHMGDNKDPVKDVTSDIRTEQYISAINQSLRTLEMEMKLSVGTFSFDGRSMKTATEVVSENDLTYRTRNDHVYEVEQFIKGLIVSVLELARATVFNGKKLFDGEIPTFEHIGVDFDDGVFQDRSALLDFYGKAKTFKFIPTTEAIQRIFKVPKETAEQWVQEMDEEERQQAPEVEDLKAEGAMFGVME